VCEGKPITIGGTQQLIVVCGSGSCTITSHKANCLLRACLDYRQIFIIAICVL